MQLSVFTSETPLSKTFRPGPNGLEKLSGGKLARGYVERKTFLCLDDFAEYLGGLNGVNALAYGIPKHERARVLSKKEAGSEKDESLPVILRTRENFSWPRGEGIFMLDHDVRKDRSVVLSQEELLAAIFKTCPDLASAPVLLTHSASSHIYAKGEPVSGQAGMRIYVRVKDATDIPRAGKALYKRLWLAGFGYIEIGQSGVPYERSLIDASVWAPERLDFAGGAHCEPPYTQHRPAPVLLNEDFDADAFDTRLIKDLTEEEETRYQRLVDNAKHEVKALAEQKRSEWLLSLPEDRRATVEKSIESGTLPSDFVLTGVNGEEFTVAEALADRGKYHGTYVQHPFEPDYQPGNDKLAQLKLDDNPQPCIHTFAHGGQTFWLDTAEVEFTPVEQPEAKEAIQTEEPTANLVPVEFVINGFISAGVMYLGGGHGVGKSTFLAPITAVITGELPGQFEGLEVTLNRRVIYFAEDTDQIRRSRHALVKYHGMTEDRSRFLLRTAKRRTPSQIAELLKAIIKKHTIPGPNGFPIRPLVIFDTSNANFEIENENDSQMVGKFIAAIKENAAGAPVWLIGHIAKALLRADFESLTGRGSGAWEADAQQTAFIFMDEGVGQDARFFGVKKRRFEPDFQELQLRTMTNKEIVETPWGETQTVVLRHGIPCRCSKAERERAKEEAKIEKAAARVSEATQTLRTILSGYAAPVSRNTILKVAGEYGLRQKPARDALDQLIEEGAVLDNGNYMAGNAVRNDGVYLRDSEQF